MKAPKNSDEVNAAVNKNMSLISKQSFRFPSDFEPLRVGLASFFVGSSTHLREERDRLMHCGINCDPRAASDPQFKSLLSDTGNKKRSEVTSTSNQSADL